VTVFFVRWAQIDLLTYLLTKINMKFLSLSIKISVRFVKAHLQLHVFG